jgi:hypothetical protein
MGVEPKEKRGSMSESETKIGEYVVPEAAPRRSPLARTRFRGQRG